MNNTFLNRKTFRSLVLMLVLTSNAPSAAQLSALLIPYGEPEMQTASTLTFAAEADASVYESNLNSNYGNATYLRVDGASSSEVESFIRFTVSGIAATVQNAQLRVYTTTNGSTNGPAVYGANDTWTETEITWKNRPVRTSAVVDNKGALNTNTWAEYNVTALVAGNGNYTFVLVGDSTDGIRFSSREDSHPPQLVLTFNSGINTPTATATPPPTLTLSRTSTPTSPPGTTPTHTSTAAATTGSANILTFTTAADARVVQAYPTTNYGTATILGADGDTIQTSYTRFVITGVSGSIQSVKLRVFCTTNGTNNGPAAHLANSNWIESGSGGITWNTRLALLSGAFDNKGVIGTNSWVEYDVTALVTGNGTFTFALVADGNDGVLFSSREGSHAPELVITFNSGPSTATHTPTQTPTSPPGTTSTPTPTATATTGSGNLLIFPTNADARVVQSSATTNYGTSTTLAADGDTVQTSYTRFTIDGLSGSTQSVKLRVFCTTNGTSNGPAVYLANSNWIESGSGGITWNTRPALLNGVLDNKSAIGTNSWVEYDVTPLVKGNGTYTFALVADSSDGVVFSSREGTAPPQLVVTLGTEVATSTPDTQTPTTSTAPTSTPTSSDSVVLVGAGDITSCSRNQDELTAQLLDNIPGTVFTAGDNAYTDGSYSEYLNCYDPTWGRHKSRTKPSPGNHEYLSSGAAGYFQYFNNVPSYYAYNLGSWRIYSLNSEISVSATSAQITWLQDDLVKNSSQCVLAYWHKPRWSSGSNHGDSSAIQTLWQVLYNAGAELVVNGHEHNYERFAEMNAAGAISSPGLREIVAGTGGALLYPFGPPVSGSQVRNNSAYGVLKLTLRATGYDWQFVPIAGSTFSDSGSSNCH